MTSAAIPLIKIILDPHAQPRTELDDSIISEYAEAMKKGAQFPAVVVFQDNDDVYWLADGFHRSRAAREAGKTEIDAEIRRGGLRDAILHSVGANATHGMRRTNEDKRRGVTKLLLDAEWNKWSDRKIAEVAGVSAPFVGDLRVKLTVNSLQMDAGNAPSTAIPVGDPETRMVEREGKTYSMATSHIGRASREAPLSRDAASTDATAPESPNEDEDDAEDDDELAEEMVTGKQDQDSFPAEKDPRSEAILKYVGFKALLPEAEKIAVKLKRAVEAAETDLELNAFQRAVSGIKNDIIVTLGITSLKAAIALRHRALRSAASKKAKFVNVPIAESVDADDRGEDA